jgi:hypothetical protein
MFMAAFYTFMAPSFVAAGEPLNSAEIARLRAGEVVIEATHLDESGGSVRVAILMDAPAETIWKVIGSCDDARRYLEGMQQCEIPVNEPLKALTHHVIDQGWLTPEIDYWFETRRQPYSRMDISLVSGNLRKLSGYWTLEPLDSVILVEHEVKVRPETPVPRWLIRKTLKGDLPRMLICIRGLSGGSLSQTGESQDLAACQSP